MKKNLYDQLLAAFGNQRGCVTRAAEALKLKSPQRLQNWGTRGIPPSMVPAVVKAIEKARSKP